MQNAAPHSRTVSSGNGKQPHDPHDPHGPHGPSVGGALSRRFTDTAQAVALVGYRAAAATQADPGLLGLASLVMSGALLVEGVAVRRTREGRLYLAFPSRVLRNGDRRHVVRPVDAEARRLIEEQVFAQLRAKGVLP